MSAYDVHALPNRAHIGINEFRKINWLPTKERFEQCVCVNIFKFFNNTYPKYFSEIYHPLEQRQHTRRSKHKLYLPQRTSNIGQKGISYLGPRTWNKLPSEIKSVGTVNTFKHDIKTKFFEELKKREDDIYVYY